MTVLITCVIFCLEQINKTISFSKGGLYMNISKFTQKSVEAVQGCEKLAYEYGNQQIDQEHLLVSLLRLEDSLIMKLVTKMGISGGQFLNEAEQALNKLPKVSGGGQVYLTNDLNKAVSYTHLLPEIFPADGLITAFPVPAPIETAFVAQEFHLSLLAF